MMTLDTLLYRSLSSSKLYTEHDYKTNFSGFALLEIAIHHVKYKLRTIYENYGSEIIEILL